MSVPNIDDKCNVQGKDDRKGGKLNHLPGVKQQTIGRHTVS